MNTNIIQVKMPVLGAGVVVPVWLLGGRVLTDMEYWQRKVFNVPLEGERGVVPEIDEVARLYGDYRAVARLGRQVGGDRGYWTVFFARMVMDVPLGLIVQTQQEIVARKGEGLDIYWQFYIDRFERQAVGYSEVEPVKELEAWYRGEVKALWQRLEPLLSEADKTALRETIRRNRASV